MNVIRFGITLWFAALCTNLPGLLHAEPAQSVERRTFQANTQFTKTGAEATDDCLPCPSVCDAFNQSCCRLCPCCYIAVDGLVLDRVNNSANQAILVEQDINGDTVQTLLSTSDLNFDVGGGLRVIVGKQLADGCAVELSYLGLFNSNATAVTNQSDGTIVTFPGPLGPASNVFFGPNRVRTDYNTALHSAEINLVRCCCCCDCDCDSCCGTATKRCQSMEWLAGFRYVYLPETLQIFGERDEAGGTETGLYDIRTDNNLFGAQVGGRFRRCVGRWGWEATGKAGIYGNDVQQRQFLIDFPDFYLRPPIGDQHSQVAFLGELGFNLIYHLSGAWNLRAGYNLFWIDGVALAPDQLDFSADIGAGSHLDSNGSAFLHGVNLGLEARR